MPDSLYRFNCFNVEDGYDPSIGLERGELAIPGHVLRREVFDPVIEQVLSLLELQMAKIPGTPIDALILVGGFASSGSSAPRSFGRPLTRRRVSVYEGAGDVWISYSRYCEAE